MSEDKNFFEYNLISKFLLYNIFMWENHKRSLSKILRKNNLSYLDFKFIDFLFVKYKKQIVKWLDNEKGNLFTKEKKLLYKIVETFTKKFPESFVFEKI